MAYTNDVFISYKRGSINEQWLDEIFLPLFNSYLDALLTNELKIFVDRRGVINGTPWAKTLLSELAHSKCMVAVISPSYFFRRSEWCVREFMSMRHREEELNIVPQGQPPCLIWPVMIQSIQENLKPPVIHEIELKDYSPYNRVGEGFKTQPAYSRFQDNLNADCRIIANIIESAPAWNMEWETPEWRNEIERRVTDHFNNYNPPQQGL